MRAKLSFCNLVDLTASSGNQSTCMMMTRVCETWQGGRNHLSKIILAQIKIRYNQIKFGWAGVSQSPPQQQIPSWSTPSPGRPCPGLPSGSLQNQTPGQGVFYLFVPSSFSSCDIFVSYHCKLRDLNRAVVFPSRPVKLKASYSCPSYWTNLLSVSLTREVFSSFDNHKSGPFCNFFC